ncbi:MAG: hypothetical protein IJM62_06965, partial [Lachnospiraceae bacterium]|nr:hypothetical protein [Lachnospiraceae bacterium]
MKAKGKLYGVGTGPGDPELLTIKAVRILESADVIAFPGRVPEETLAYRIIKDVVGGLDKKTLLGIDFQMTKDPDRLAEAHRHHRAEKDRHLRLYHRTLCRLWRHV